MYRVLKGAQYRSLATGSYQTEFTRLLLQAEVDQGCVDATVHSPDYDDIPFLYIFVADCHALMSHPCCRPQDFAHGHLPRQTFHQGSLELLRAHALYREGGLCLRTSGLVPFGQIKPRRYLRSHLVSHSRVSADPFPNQGLSPGMEALPKHNLHLQPLPTPVSM